MTLEALKAAGLVAKLSVDVKMLGEGELTKKLSVTAHSFSKSAAEKIEAAGGTVRGSASLSSARRRGTR